MCPLRNTAIVVCQNLTPVATSNLIIDHRLVSALNYVSHKMPNCKQNISISYTVLYFDSVRNCYKTFQPTDRRKQLMSYCYLLTPTSL